MIARCPTCNVPLTRDEEEGRACPACGHSLHSGPLPPAPRGPGETAKGGCLAMAIGVAVCGLLPAIAVFAWLARPVGQLPREGFVGRLVMQMGGAHGFASIPCGMMVFVLGGVLGVLLGWQLGGRRTDGPRDLDR